MNARLKKIRQQQAMAEAKHKCCIHTALSSLQESVELFRDAKRGNEYACSKPLRDRLTRIHNWTHEAMQDVGGNVSAGMMRDFKVLANELYEIRADMCGKGKINVVQGAADLFALAQLVTDIKAVEHFKSKPWKFLGITLNNLTATLVEYVPEMEEEACECGTRMFDRLYPEWGTQEWKEAA